MKAIFIGYDIPLALSIKYDEIMPVLDRMFQRIEYEGDQVHLVNNEENINAIQIMLEEYNAQHDMGLTLDVFEIDFETKFF